MNPVTAQIRKTQSCKVSSCQRPWLFSLIIEDSRVCWRTPSVRVLVAPAKKYVGLFRYDACDGFDAAAKENRDLGTSRWQLPRQ